MIPIRKTVVLLALLASTTASAVSRIGGGKLSNEELGFVAEVPELFPFGEVDRDGNARLEGLVPAGASRLGRAFIHIWPTALHVPELNSIHAPEEMDRWFKERGWRQRPGLAPCVHMYVSRNESGLTVALMWGAGKGVLISGEYIPSVYKGMNKLISSFVVTPESCSWRP
jgi:hypothetical protein